MKKQNTGNRTKKPHHPFLWVFGFLFFFGACFYMFLNPLAAFVLFILAIIYLPPGSDFLYRAFGIDLGKRCRILFLAIGIPLFLLAVT